MKAWLRRCIQWAGLTGRHYKPTSFPARLRSALKKLHGKKQNRRHSA